MLTAFLWMSLQTAGEQGSSESKQNRGLWEKESCTDNKNMRLGWWCVHKLSNNQRINPKVKQSNNPRYLINCFYGHFSQTRCSFKTINHTLVKMTERRGEERRGEERKSLCLLVFLTLSSTRPRRPSDTGPNPKSKLAPRCGNLIQFPLFSRGPNSGHSEFAHCLRGNKKSLRGYHSLRGRSLHVDGRVRRRDTSRS